MRYVGLDVHKHSIEVCILDDAGTVVKRCKVPCRREQISRFASIQLRPDDQVVLEATTNTWAVVDILEPLVGRVVVSNPLRTKAIAEAKVKTDKIDANVLAQLLRCDFLPPVWQPDMKTRQLRKLTSTRASLSADSTRCKNRIHSALAQALIEPPDCGIFSKDGREWLDSVEVPEDERIIINIELALLERIEEQITQLDLYLAKLAYEREQIRLLMALPGVHFAAAQGLLAALGDISRFRGMRIMQQVTLD